MAKNLVEKLIDEAIDTKGTYVEFIVSPGNVAFISDGGSRRSTRNKALDKKEIDSVERTLKKLDETCLLFTGKLCRIHIVLLDGREASFIRKDSEHICRIEGKKINESTVKEYRWVRFNDESDVRCGVAFSIKKIKEKEQIQPCKGCILNGAYDSDISTDLQFIMSGDFHGKGAIPDLKYAEQNAKATQKVGNILETAIGNMIHIGFLSMSLFSVLPSTLDEDTDINTEMIKATKRACKSHHLFRNRAGTITLINKAMLGTNAVTELFPQELIEHLFEGRYWVEKCIEGSREEYFLIDMGVPYYDREKFLQALFVDEKLDEISRILENKNDRWLRDFYIFCSDDIYEDKTRRSVISALKNIRSIRDSKGKMRFPYEISVMTGEHAPINKSIVVKNSLIYPSGKEDKYSEQIKRFLLDDLAIKSFSLKQDMEKLANDLMNKKQPIDKLYCERLLILADYQLRSSGEVDLSQYAMFPYESAKGISRAKGSELVIGKPFVEEGILLEKAMERPPIWKGLRKLLSEVELEKVLSFAVKCGAVGKPCIMQQKAEDHISFSKELYAPGKQGVRDSNIDYFVPGLDDLLKLRSTRRTKLVWNAILEAGKDESVLYAEYSTDNRNIVNRTDSSLIKILRERTWVVGIDGKFYKPENIDIADISKDLPYDNKNAILKSLRFGSGIKEKKKRLEELRKLVEKEGLHLIAENEYQEFLEWKKNMGKAK